MLPSHFMLLPLALVSFMISGTSGREDVWIDVPCNKVFVPENCDFDSSSTNYLTIDDFDRCAPAKIPINARNYFIGVAGRGITYKDNKDAFDRIRMKPKMLRDVSGSSLKTKVLGLDVDLPIGLSPVALHKLAHPLGELATVSGLANIRTIMILSCFASTTLEDVAAAALGKNLHLWMQTYIFENRSITVDLVRRAERNGFKAIVLTSDSPIDATIKCNARMDIIFPPGIKSEMVEYFTNEYDISTNFVDITWLKSITKLPIIAKGILSGTDARQAVLAGASAIIVSNHGGRQMDGDPATIDALPGVVEAMQSFTPPIEVYMDGGIRSGSDVYKAIARGAKMVFYGRPNLWGLALGGFNGVRRVMNTFQNDFNQTMLLAGNRFVADITSDTLINPPDTKKAQFPLFGDFLP